MKIKSQEERPLTIKEKAFLSEYFLCMNGTKAYMKIFKPKNENVAAVEAHKLLRKPKVKQAVRDWLDNTGYSEERLKMKVLSLMEAKTVKIATHEGLITDTLDVEDNVTQKGMTEIALKMKGLLTEKIEHSGSLSVINLDPKDEEISKEAAKIALEKITGSK